MTNEGDFILRFQSMGIVLAASLLGVWIFTLLHLPVPWLLGPLFTVLISQFFIKQDFYWPAHFRNIGLVVVGVSIGQIFQLDVFTGAGSLLVMMVLVNITIVVVCVLISFFLVKYGNLSLKTALTAMVPGGLAQIVTFAEEEENIDLAVVTFFHVFRVITIVLGLPLILSGHIAESGKDGSFLLSMIPSLILLLLVAGGAVFIGKKIKLPVPYFLSPVLLIIGLQLFSIETPEVPSHLLHIAQLMIGAYIGQLLKPPMLKLGRRVLLLGIGTSFLLLAFTFGQGWVLFKVMGYSLSTGFLSTAAGGLDQMSLLASAIGADVSTVTVFQIFRILFVFICVLPLLKMACAYIDRKSFIDKI